MLTDKEGDLMVLSKEMAINILIAEKDRFLDEHIDYGNVANAYDMAIDSLKAETKAYKPMAEKALLDFQSWYYVCGKCNKRIDFNDIYCKHCGTLINHV